MPKYGVQISDDVQVELDVAPNAPPLTRVVLEWEVAPGEASETLVRLGGREKFYDIGGYAFGRYNVPLTRDGEQVGKAMLKVKVGVSV
jgi:hypothetical protein